MGDLIELGDYREAMTTRAAIKVARRALVKEVRVKPETSFESAGDPLGWLRDTAAAAARAAPPPPSIAEALELEREANAGPIDEGVRAAIEGRRR